MVVEWSAESQESAAYGSAVLFLLEERHHVGRHFTSARLSNWVPRHRSSRTNVTLKNSLRPGHWYQFRVAAISANGTRGFSEPSAPFALSVGMLNYFSFSISLCMNSGVQSVGRHCVVDNEIVVK